MIQLLHFTLVSNYPLEGTLGVFFEVKQEVETEVEVEKPTIQLSNNPPLRLCENPSIQ